ncbi:magnesium transporter, partial [Hungatella effluvii]
MQENFNMEELMDLLFTRQFRKLKDILTEMNEVDIATFIEELDSEKTVVVFRMLPKELASDVFACLEVDKQEHIINSITDYELGTIVDDLFVDDAVDMLEELPANVVKRVLKNARPDTRKLINQFLNYPENSAGSIMTAEYVGLKQSMTVEQAFAYIRKNGVDKETIYTCYVMDAKRRLEGVVTVKDLLMNPYEEIIGNIMDTHVIKAFTTEDQEEVADSFQKYDLLSLPVVDHEERLVGIVTVDDVVDVMEQEATEDFEKMAAMLPSEKPYLKTGVFQLAKNRIAWLLILMISSMITGGILAKYEAAFAVIPLLVTFIPMLTDTGGNAGSQSSTMIIRGMAVGEIEPGDLFKVLWKELRVGIIVGAILGFVNYVRLVIL